MTEEEKAKKRAYYAKNRAKVKAYQKEWRERNPEKVAMYEYKSWMKKAMNNKEN